MARKGERGRRASARDAKGKAKPAPFRYAHAGSLATIGRSAAVVDFGWIKLKGRIAWWLWGIAHIYFLIGFRNRLVVLIDWASAYWSKQRYARVVTGLGKGDTP